MATSSPVTLFNTDPNIQAQAAILQQRQALAQALQAEGLKPMDTSNRSIGGVGYRISPFEGLGKLAQAVSGQRMMQDTVGQQAQLAAQAYGNLLQRYQPGTDPQFTPGQMQGAEQAGMPSNQMGPPDPTKMAQYLQGQTPSGGVNPNNPMGIPAPILAQRNGGMMDDETFKALTSGYGATDATKAALQGGLNPQNANRAAFQKAQTDPKIFAMQQAGFTPQQIYAAQFGEAAKAAEIERKGGNEFVNPVLGASGIVPRIPENSNPVGGVAPNGGIPGGVAPMPGATPVVQGNSKASARGTAQGSLRDVTLNDGRVVPVYGDSIPPQAGVQGNFKGDAAALYDAAEKIKDPQERANVKSAIDEQVRRQGETLRLGQSTADKAGQQAGSTNAQEELSKSWAGQQAAHQTSQSNVALLSQMRDLADKAITGYEPDKRAYLAKLGAYAGITSMDQKASATDLYNKYSAQLVAGLAQKGGMSTDAARDLVLAGTPNNHMQSAAAKEAIDGLIAREQITQARTQALQQFAQKRDATGYQQAASTFDLAADQRLWQMRNMPPKQAEGYVENLKRTQPGEYAALMHKATVLRQMGAY